MKVYSYSQARQHFAEVLDTAKKEEVLIRRKGGDVFAVALQKPMKSPFDVPGVKTHATTADILSAIKHVRSSR